MYGCAWLTRGGGCDPARIAIPTTIAFGVVSQWFDARRGLATGCVTLGAPLGGIFFSLVLQRLFGRYSWKTAGLILAGIMTTLLIVGNLLVETNLPPRKKAASDRGDGSEGRAAEVSRMLKSPKFWFVSYALFGKFLHVNLCTGRSAPFSWCVVSLSNP